MEEGEEVQIEGEDPEDEQNVGEGHFEEDDDLPEQEDDVDDGAGVDEQEMMDQEEGEEEVGDFLRNPEQMQDD